MLICKNGRLYAGRSSFSLADGCKVNDAPLAAYRNGINLCTGDETCMIDVNFEHGVGGARESIEDSMVSEELADLSPKVESRTYGGQTCWCIEYTGDLHRYFEARFDAPTGLKDSEGRDINIFRMVVTAPHDSNIKSVRRKSEIAGLLNSFQP